MGELRPWHIAVMVVVLILLFGSKRLPDAARGLGRSMRILKAETRGLADDAPAGGQTTAGPDAAAPDARAAAAPEQLTAQQVAAQEVSGPQAQVPSTARLDG